MNTRLSKKRLLIIGLAVAVVGLAYLIIGLVYVPDPAQFQVTGVLESGRTEYRPGELITVEPFLTYTGIIPATIFAGLPLLSVDVYTADNEKVLELPKLGEVLVVDIGLFHTVRLKVPFNDEDAWRRWIPDIRDYLGSYSFRLEQPGSFYVVVRAEFGLGRYVGAQRLRVYYSEPIWLEIVG